jgi:aminopeptidase N
MPFIRPRAAVLAAMSALLTVPLAAGPATSAPYDGGLSAPHEDSYYPAKGDPGIDTLHYALELGWDRANRTLHGLADIRLRATETADSFQLDLGAAMRVASVEVGGRRVPSTHRRHILEVRSPVTEDRRYHVRIAYRGTPRTIPAPTTRSDFSRVGMRVTSDRQLTTQQEPFGALTWYPVNDQPSDKALYDLTITAPRSWVGVSNGTLRYKRTTERHTITRFHLAHPAASYLMTLAVGPYVHRRATGPHRLPLNFWLPRGDTARYLKALRHVGDDLRWLESKLGRYPFESAGVVMAPGSSAVETQTLVTFGRRSWRSAKSGRETLVHELAHQWWGDTVTPTDWRDLWLNEGMAMYLEARWSAEHTTARWRWWLSDFRYGNRVLRSEQGGPGAYDPSMFATGCVYYCTALMYDQLRKRVGNEQFWTIVRRWPQAHPDRNADRASFERFVEARTGDDLTRFFDRWLNAPVWPPA